MQIEWQSEPGGPGDTIEAVVQAAIDHIRELNVAPFNCRENSLAVTDLESAQNWLNRRTADRRARGVEGTREP